MSGYAVAQIDEIDEISDGRCPWRPVRFHFGITSFGVNAFTAHQVGDRLINEHDESQEHDLQEELYLVQRGRATFELDGERVDAPAGTLVFVRPEVKRTAFAEEPGTTLVAVGGTPGKAYEAPGRRALDAAPPSLRVRRIRRGCRSGTRVDRSSSRVRRAALQPRVLREPRRSDRRRDQASPARDRPPRVVPFACCRGQRLRPDPRRGRFQGTGSGQRSRANHGVTDFAPSFEPTAIGVHSRTLAQRRSCGPAVALRHRGSGFGPVAVTSRCGTQSSTWLKPSKRPPSSSTTSKKERR